MYEYDYYIIVDNLDNIRSEVISIYQGAPSNLVASNITNTSFVLSWTIPSSGLVYEIFKDGVYIGTTSTNLYSVTNLSHSQYYEMTVKVRKPVTQMYSVSPPLFVNTLLAENTLINGSFEKPFPLTGTFRYLSNDTHFSWAYSGGSGIARSYKPFNDSIDVPERAQSAFLQGDSEISQYINLENDGRLISISFMAAQRRLNVSDIEIQVKIDDQVIGSFTPSSKDTYNLYTTIPFQADGVKKISFVTNKIGTEDNTILIDDINVNLYIQNETLNGAQNITANNIYINSDTININELGPVIIPNDANIIFDARNNVFINKEMKVIQGGTYKIKK